ncbi:molybdenum cofactor biosynthesis protein MoaE [Chryseosolibacter indicus]|uniref:Molybdopterin synthase catalytic subunit n=1 Tax=Chryseosolibacter indicus TaxID=2782351 RepID=A0ABS5VPY9_9BACT|nr:molybdenum cofactor biosynthesis protein MoaE [Chryseosolibacter indicus]MBT1703515.1 molybdenum cofactor biosynthesis protein MoaE [Chryseosolibacter indicus]
MIQITEHNINIEEIVKAASRHEAGAVNVFIGTVRNHTKGRNVLRLEYEAYEAMAISEIKKIVDEAILRWSLLGCAISHRVGVLTPGEVAVVVAVSTPHRADSFTACQFIIDTLKQQVPIWKKEVFEGGEEWISATP